MKNVYGKWMIEFEKHLKTDLNFMVLELTISNTGKYFHTLVDMYILVYLEVIYVLYNKPSIQV